MPAVANLNAAPTVAMEPTVTGVVTPIVHPGPSQVGGRFLAASGVAVADWPASFWLLFHFHDDNTLCHPPLRVARASSV
jgi:hypothetical protein